jgi:3-oxoacyl-[acyl-carrier-protein] synthase-3
MIVRSRISGFGYYTPRHTLSNADIASRSDITDEWIVSRTGISSRCILTGDMTGTDMALYAAESALSKAGYTANDLSHILYATCTPDACCPSAACTLSAKLNIKGRMAVDLNAACAGFINGLILADALLARSPSACVLLAASESLSHRCNWEDHSTAVLFGDGAGVVLVSAEQPSLMPSGSSGVVVDTLVGSDGSKGDLLLISGGFSASPYTLGERVGPEYFIRMQGGPVFKHAVRNMSASCLTLLERNALSQADVDLFIPHQANLRIIEAVGSRLGIPEHKVFLNVQRYGNTSAASIPLALGEAIETGRLLPGMRVLVTSFGGGLTWGAALLQF